MKILKIDVLDGNPDIEIAVSDQMDYERLKKYIDDNKKTMFDIEELREKIHAIGDYAHDNNTGPAVHDALWDIRQMCYELI